MIKIICCVVMLFVCLITALLVRKTNIRHYVDVLL